LRKDDEENTGPGIGYYVTSIVLDIVLGILASIVVAWFSRQREFRADAGAAELMGRKQPMINALTRLQHMQSEGLPPSLQAMGISEWFGQDVFIASSVGRAYRCITNQLICFVNAVRPKLGRSRFFPLVARA
jgi:Zn-dependent protease with chaperone function